MKITGGSVEVADFETTQDLDQIVPQLTRLPMRIVRCIRDKNPVSSTRC